MYKKVSTKTYKFVAGIVFLMFTLIGCDTRLHQIQIPVDSVGVSKGNIVFTHDQVILYKDTNTLLTDNYFVIVYNDSITIHDYRERNTDFIILDRNLVHVQKRGVIIPGSLKTVKNGIITIHDKPIRKMSTAAQSFIIVIIVLVFIFIVLVGYSVYAGRAFINGVHIHPRLLISLVIYKVPMSLIIECMITAKRTGVKISVRDIKELYLANVDVKLILGCMTKAKNAGLEVTMDQLKKHSLAGGHIGKVVEAMIEANNADKEMSNREKLNLDFKMATNIDLAGLDVAQTVHDCINFQVYETDGARGVPLDGVELFMKCKVTLRPLIRKIVGGAGYQTVLARVSEAVETEIGNAVSHYDVLKSPYLIADKIETITTLTANTAYEMLSVDISDIKIGKDIHAELAIERAEAAKANAVADNLKAIAMEQAMKAKTQEATSKVIEAQVEVQKAMAAAFLDGSLNMQEYQRILNSQADTKMRDSFADMGKMTPNPMDRMNFLSKKEENHHNTSHNTQHNTEVSNHNSNPKQEENKHEDKHNESNNDNNHGHH